MNYTNYDINTLVEMLDTAAHEEKDQIIQEIAYRYRMGIGVDTDHEEAAHWEQKLSVPPAEDKQEAEPEYEPIEPIEPASVDYEQVSYENMSFGSLYEKSREGDPWATYYFAVQSGEKGDVDCALKDLTTLSDNIENQMLAGTMTEDTRRLLAMIKLQLGILYTKKHEMQPAFFSNWSDSDSVLPSNLSNARNMLEISALELGYSPAFPHLIENYKADGLSKHIDKILSPLQRMEKGPMADRLFVAATYSEIGYKARAAGIYQSLLEHNDLTTEQRIDISHKLFGLDKQFADHISSRAAENDAIAQMALARKMTDENRLSEAFIIYEAIDSQDSYIVKSCSEGKAFILDRILTSPHNHPASPDFYQNLLKRDDLTVEQRMAITNELVRYGVYTQEELESRSSYGDGIATAALAHFLFKKGDLDGAYRYFEYAREKDEALKDYCDEQLKLVNNALERKREEYILTQKRIKAQQEQEKQHAAYILEEERQAKKDRRKQRLNRVMNWAKNHKLIAGFILIVSVTYILQILLGLLLGIFSFFGFLSADRVDAFKSVQVDFYGIEPYGEVRVLNYSDDPFLQSIEYKPSQTGDLSNKSKVTITAEYSDKLASEYGYRLKSKTKVYTVEDLPYYVYEIDELTKDDKAQLNAKAQASLEKYLSEASFRDLCNDADIENIKWGDNEAAFSKLTLDSCYFQALRPDNRGYFYNRYLVFFKVNLELFCDGEKFHDDKYYYAVSLNNIVINNSEATVDSDVLSSEKIVSSSNQVDIIEVQAKVADAANSRDDLYEKQISEYMTNYITTK